VLIGSGVPVLGKEVLEVPISVKVRVPIGRLWAFEGSPPVGLLEALTGSLPEEVSAGGLEALRGSLPEGVLEALRGSLPEGVSAGGLEIPEGSPPEGVAEVLSAKWMNMSEDMIHRQL